MCFVESLSSLDKTTLLEHLPLSAPRHLQFHAPWNLKSINFLLMAPKYHQYVRPLSTCRLSLQTGIIVGFFVISIHSTTPPCMMTIVKRPSYVLPRLIVILYLSTLGVATSSSDFIDRRLGQTSRRASTYHCVPFITILSTKAPSRFHPKFGHVVSPSTMIYR
jgi:hypothetical protein